MKPDRRYLAVQTQQSYKGLQDCIGSKDTRERPQEASERQKSHMGRIELRR